MGRILGPIQCWPACSAMPVATGMADGGSLAIQILTWSFSLAGHSSSADCVQF